MNMTVTRHALRVHAGAGRPLAHSPGHTPANTPTQSNNNARSAPMSRASSTIARMTPPRPCRSDGRTPTDVPSNTARSSWQEATSETAAVIWNEHLGKENPNLDLERLLHTQLVQMRPLSPAPPALKISSEIFKAVTPSTACGHAACTYGRQRKETQKNCAEPPDECLLF